MEGLDELWRCCHRVSSPPHQPSCAPRQRAHKGRTRTPHRVDEHRRHAERLGHGDPRHAEHGRQPPRRLLLLLLLPSAAVVAPHVGVRQEGQHQVGTPQLRVALAAAAATTKAAAAAADADAAARGATAAAAAANTTVSQDARKRKGRQRADLRAQPPAAGDGELRDGVQRALPRLKLRVQQPLNAVGVCVVCGCEVRGRGRFVRWRGQSEDRRTRGITATAAERRRSGRSSASRGAPQLPYAACSTAASAAVAATAAAARRAPTTRALRAARSRARACECVALTRAHLVGGSTVGKKPRSAEGAENSKCSAPPAHAIALLRGLCERGESAGPTRHFAGLITTADLIIARCLKTAAPCCRK